MQNTRRHLIKLVPGLLLTPCVYAQLLMRTPRQTKGPFYPDNLPLDHDNDLIIISDSLTPAIGQILNLTGQVLDVNGVGINNATVEIWQTDANGRYIHSDDYQKGKNDSNFQGYGQFLTDSKGQYRFRTIRPVAYGSGFGSRSPHIHFAISAKGFRPLITQMYFADEDNSTDGLWTRLSEAEKTALTMQPRPVPDSPLAEQVAQFNIVLA